MPQLFLDSADPRAREVAVAVRNCIEEAEAAERREQEWLEAQKAASERKGILKRLRARFRPGN
ncbi:MAG: hypothetical protein ACO3N7_01695 [Kiritimatiellia bacterium]